MRVGWRIGPHAHVGRAETMRRLDWLRPRKADPIVNVYTEGDGTEPIPKGAVEVTARAWGHGGAGSSDGIGVTLDGTGGGSGAFVELVSDVDPSEWGGELAWAVGAGGDPTTITGSVGGEARAFSAGAGENGTTPTGGNPVPEPAAGGTASGGTTNTNGSSASGSTGGDAPGPDGGEGGTVGLPGNPGEAPGGGGGGGQSQGGGSVVPGGAGGAGRVEIEWRVRFLP